MKKEKIYIAGLTMMLGACSAESPFSVEPETDIATLHKSALSIDVRSEDNDPVHPTRTVDMNDCRLVIYGPDAQVESSFKLGEMGSTVSIKTGRHLITAELGTDNLQAWEAPFYKGCSSSFDVNPGDGIKSLDPIVCHLANVKVTVDFDSSLGESSDLKVEVSVVSGSSLTFVQGETRAGYFGKILTGFDGEHQGDPVTLYATVSGTVDGGYVEETKTLSNVKAGNGYKLNFRMSNPNTSGTGSVGMDDEESFKIDAVVNIKDLSEGGNTSIDPGEEEVMTGVVIGGQEGTGGGGHQSGDDPGKDPNGEDPGKDPGTDPGTETKGGPSITINAPLDLDKANPVTEGMTCVLTVKSEAEDGIQTFDVVIDSETLTEDILTDVGLGKNLNIAKTPEDFVEGLESLDLPVNVKGRQEVEFNISQFMPLLGIYGAATHKFVVTVSDANGTVTKTLTLVTE